MADMSSHQTEQVNDGPSPQDLRGYGHELYGRDYKAQPRGNGQYQHLCQDYYSAATDGYSRMPELIHCAEHAQPYAAHSDGVFVDGRSSDCAFLVQPGRTVPDVRQPPYTSCIEPTNGYSYRARMCPPVTPGVVQPLPTSLAAPWVYPLPRTMSDSVYGYAANVPYVAATSLIPSPMIYPPPLLPPFVNPSAPHPIARTDGAEYINYRKKEHRKHPTVSYHTPTKNDTTKAFRRPESFKSKEVRKVERTSYGNAASNIRGSPSSAAGRVQIPSKSTSINDRVLAKFKTTKNDSFTLENARGHLLSFCLDQAGSRFIQEQLALPNADIAAVYDELSAHIPSLMQDVFGNYIIQLLLQRGTREHRSALAEILNQNTLSMALHVYGCRVVQTALEVLEVDNAIKIVNNLEAYISRCIKDMNGNHVIQKAIRVLELEEIPSIVKVVEDRVLPFAVHPYGCRVVQRILERRSNSSTVSTAQMKIMTTIVDNMAELSQDLYGNYVAQHVLRFSDKSLRKRAIDGLMMAPVDYACHKYASNVLEEALVSADDEEKRTMVKAFITSQRRGDGGDSLNTLATNRFGNYVIQRLLDVVEQDLCQLLVSCYSPRVKTLKKFKYGKHIAALVEKMTSNTVESDEEGPPRSF